MKQFIGRVDTHRELLPCTHTHNPRTRMCARDKDVLAVVLGGTPSRRAARTAASRPCCNRTCRAAPCRWPQAPRTRSGRGCTGCALGLPAGSRACPGAAAAARTSAPHAPCCYPPYQPVTHAWPAPSAPATLPFPRHALQHSTPCYCPNHSAHSPTCPPPSG